MPNPLLAIEDTNLRLAIIDRLLETKQLPEFDRAAFLRQGDEEDDEGSGDEDSDKDSDKDYEYNDDIAEALLGLPVTAGQCAGIRELYWEAGNNDIIFTIWTYWGGEGDEFRVESLAGLDRVVPDLESLSIALCTISDLSPLAGLTKLTELALDGGGPVTDLSPIAGLTSLRKLELNHILSPEHPDVLRSITGLPLEHINLDTGGRNPVVDLAPLEHMLSLRTLSFRRTVRITGSEPPVATAFGNARVIEVLKARGVKVDVV